MKSTIKKILPLPVMNKARDIRDIVALTKLARQDFDARNLNTNAAIQAVLNDPQAAQNWETDHAAITGVLQDDDKAGGVNPGDRRALYMLIAGLKPRSVLEIGTHIGASTLYIARALKAAGQGGMVTTVDIYNVNAPDAAWNRVGLKAAPLENVKTVGCADIVTFIAQPSQAFMKETGKRFDFIFLDGDHSAVAVYNELSCALNILSPGGVILLHDYYTDGKPLFPDGKLISGPFRALKRVCAENPDITVQPLGNLPWPTKQGTYTTSLALVTKKA